MRRKRNTVEDSGFGAVGGGRGGTINEGLCPVIISISMAVSMVCENLLAVACCPFSTTLNEGSATIDRIAPWIWQPEP